MTKVKVMQVGIGGYGMSYLKPILSELNNDKYQLVGVVDPMADKCPLYDQVVANNIPIYASIEEFFDNDSADLTIIAAPIGFHCRYTCYALEHGSNVLCEKPVAATIQEARLMHETELRTGKFVAIGFQWSFADAMLDAKADFIAGKFGKPLKFKANVLWRRDFKYYGRNNWAGKLRDSHGTWILDSVVHNATAHYLHNIFYMMGNEIDKSAKPVSIQSELYRANDIENFDTCAIRAQMDNGAEVLYYATHAIEFSDMPNFVYTFENGKLVYGDVGEKMTTPKMVRYISNDGTEINYGDPFLSDTKKLRDCIDAVLYGKKITCGVEAASSHLFTINFLADNVKINAFDDKYIVRNDEQVYVTNLGEDLKKAYLAEKLPYEMGFEWAKMSDKLDCSEYTEFKGCI